MKKLSILFIILSSIIISSCSSDTKQQNESNKTSSAQPTVKNQNLNLSIFLDVSDRISPKAHPNATMEYYKRDIGYLNSVTKAFEAHMLHKRIVLMNDRVQLFIEPAPGNADINDIIRQLRISFDKNNVTKEKIEGINSNYTELSTKLYELAIQDDNYIGSDIWGFFKNKIEDYCISEEHRNVFVIITDGYAYHKDNVINDGNRTSFLTTKKVKQLGLNNSNWEQRLSEKDCGFIVKKNGLDNLEVLVLGINAYKNSPYEEDVIRTYWTNWLTEMGVKRFAIKSADLPSNLDEVIQKFILNP